jgi:hypothetical protein
MHFSIQIWDRKTGVLLNDLPNLHAGRVFSVVGDRTKAVSTGLDQVRRTRVIGTRPFGRRLILFAFSTPQRIIIWDFGYGLDTSFVEM